MPLKFLDALPAATSLAAQRQVVVNISSATVDRQGDIVVQEGIDTRSFLAAGGTILFNHDAALPVAKCISIGLVGGKVRAVAQFPPPAISPTADQCYGLIRTGTLCGASIGFRALESEPIDPKNPWDGRRFVKTELMEFSFVSVPAQPEATILAKGLKSGRVLSAANAASLAALKKCLDKSADAQDEAIERLAEAERHRKRAASHASRIAANAGADDGDDEYGDDGDDDSDVELSLRSFRRRLARSRRSNDPSRAARIRLVEVMARSQPHIESDPGRERRLREVDIAQRRASP